MVGVKTGRVEAAAKAVTEEASTATAAAAAAAAATATTTAKKAAAATAEDDDDDDERVVGRISVTSIWMGRKKWNAMALVPPTAYTKTMISAHNGNYGIFQIV